MDPAAIELAKQIYGILKRPPIAAAATKGLELFEKPLVDAFPLLRQLSAIRVRQIKRSVVRLEERLRQVEHTQDGGRLLGFANMCFRYFEAGAKEHREFKLKLLATACAHCAAADNADPFDVELEVFDAIERLQPFHIRVLHYLQEHDVELRPGGAHRHIAGAS